VLIQYITGLLTGAALCSSLFLYFLQLKKQPAKQQEPVDEEAKRKAKETHEHFQSLMNYDVNQALQRKKVT
jgi:hypothetical protein